ncbi:reverse transcriptase domain-containing protein [Tanacetum coccineum]
MDMAEVNVIVEEEGRTWMTPIMKYIEKGTLPEDTAEARTMREKANYVIREIHMGSSRMHDWPRRVVHKAINAGYYWPRKHRDANNKIRSCDACQDSADQRAIQVLGRGTRDKAHLNINISPTSKRSGRKSQPEHNVGGQDKVTPGRSRMGRRATERVMGP